MLEIKKVTNGSETKVGLVGRLDTSSAPELESALADVDGAARLTLGFEGLEYISSAGLRILLMLHKKLSKAGGSLALTGVCDSVYEVLDITGFSDILSIEKA